MPDEAERPRCCASLSNRHAGSLNVQDRVAFATVRPLAVLGPRPTIRNNVDVSAT